MSAMFSNAVAYDRYMGRWSRLLAPLFVEFAQVGEGSKVLDVGCGTGVLSETLASLTGASEIIGIDRSDAFVDHGQTRSTDPRIKCELGDAVDLPYPDNTFDHCLSLLVLQLIPDREKALSEMCRVTRRGGSVSACNWDGGGRMELQSTFREEAGKLDPAGFQKLTNHLLRPYSEGELKELWKATGFQEVQETGFKIDLAFACFEDYWLPQLHAVGPVGSYLASLPSDGQEALRSAMWKRFLGDGPDGPFRLHAQAWAVRGRLPQ